MKEIPRRVSTKGDINMSYKKPQRSVSELFTDAFSEGVLFGCAFSLIMLAIMLLVGAIFAVILMWAWNLFMPAVFNLPTIDFWQAYALSWLISLLTSGFRRATSR